MIRNHHLLVKKRSLTPSCNETHLTITTDKLLYDPYNDTGM